VVYKEPKSTDDGMATDCIGLRLLDPDEVVSIELFATGNFCSQSGLLAAERPGTPMTDEELNEAQRFSDEIDAARKEGRLPPDLQDLFDD
jgi:hypothetical protein